VTVIENGHANYGWADYCNNHLGPELKEMKNVKYGLSDIEVNTSGHLAWTRFKYSIAADFRERHIEGGGMGTAGKSCIGIRATRAGWLRPALRKRTESELCCAFVPTIQANGLLHD